MKYCIVQTFERVTGVAGQDGTEDAIKNELECPLLLQSKIFVILQSDAIQNTVPLVHQCSRTCTFQKKTVHRTIEREDIRVSSLFVYCHDWRNNLFCLNIYKMA